MATTELKYRHYLPQEIVRAKTPVKVLIVGAGGNGSRIFTGLAQMHVALTELGHPGLAVTLVDPDRVSSSNPGRQLFTRPDIGLNKATVLATHANNHFGLGWDAYPVSFEKLSFEDTRDGGIHFIISCVDKVSVRRKIVEQIHKTLYLIDVGNTKKTGQVILGTCPKGIKQPNYPGAVSYIPHAFELYPNMEEYEKDAIQGPSCSMAESLRRQDLIINHWVADGCLQLLWDGFHDGYLENSGVFIDAGAYKVRPLPIDPAVWARMGVKGEKELKKAA